MSKTSRSLISTKRRRDVAAAAVTGIFLASSVKSASAAFAGGIFIDAICDIYSLIQGDLGGLLAASAGILAIVTAAFGSLKGAGAFVVTAIAAFTLSNGVTAWFGEFGCGESAPTRVAAPAAATPRIEEGLFRELPEDAPLAGAAPEEAGDEASGDPFQRF